MRVAFFSTQAYERPFFDVANNSQHELHFIQDALTIKSLKKIKNCDAICCFVTDCLDQKIITQLAKQNVKLIALRSAGYDHVDLAAARKQGITVVRAPKYSPEAVAEFAVGLILTLNRNIIQAHLRGLKFNFSLEGLMGFNLYQKTIGIIGTGNIGAAFAKIMHGFGCRILAYDPLPNDVCRTWGVEYVPLAKLFSETDIISLHCPLNKNTRYMIDTPQFAQMKPGVMLINTGRGALINTKALLHALKKGKVKYAGLDVYEKEQGLFFINHKGKKLQDNQFLKLQSQPNVLITPHQAFFTQEAVANIAKTTIENLSAFERGNILNQI